MTISPGGTGLSGKSEQVFIRLADGSHIIAPLSSSEYIERIESVQNMLLARATGREANDNLFKTLRGELVRDEYIKPLLPRFVITNRSLAEFWAYIKTKFSSYRERQEFIWGEFKPLLDGLEKGSLSYVGEVDMQIRPLSSPNEVAHMNQTELRDFIDRYFDDNELRDLCFDLGIDYESLPAIGKSAKARELIAYCQRHERYQELEKYVLESRASTPSPQPQLAVVPASDNETQSQLIQEEKNVVGSQRQIDTKIKSILFLAADPTNESRLRLGEELREIDEQLRLARQRNRFKLELPQLSLRPRDITGALLNIGPEIVHFSGHGTAKGALCFENQTGQTQLVEPDALAALFEQFAHQVDCVLLNACYSEIQAKAIARHINYVIGMNEAIGDRAAIAFALGFYQALGAGRTIEEAYKLGCVQIRLEGIPEHLTPILITKQQSKPKEQKLLQRAAVTSPVPNEPAILGSDQRLRTKFLPIPLFPGIGNSYLRDNYLDPPSGDVVLEGVKFRLEPNALIFDTSKQTRYYLPRPDGSKEVELQLRELVDHVKSACFLINSGNSKRIYTSEKIGEIILLFKDAPPLVTELILGANIREWCLGNPGDWVRETSSTASKVVWRGMSKDGANAIIDCLRIPVYESMRNCALEKIIFVHKPTNRPSDTLGVHFFVSAVSLEIEQPDT